MSFEWSGWSLFGATKNRPRIKAWLSEVRGKSQHVFSAGMLGNHTGRIYRRKGGKRHQASVNRRNAEFPANDTGRLLASLRSEQRKDRATIGTSAKHAIFLHGTKFMAKRRMSDNALTSGAHAAKPKSRGWVDWQRGKLRQERSLNK